MKDLSVIFSQLKELDEIELKAISEKILKHLKKSNTVNFEEDSVITVCRKCGDKDCLIKYGKDKNGKQRYRCKHCKAFFTETSFSVIANTHHSLDKWQKYIELLIQGLSIQKCAEICHISTHTAFDWRHKIMNALQKDQENRVMNGIVEIDDMFFNVSFKGNHKKSRRFKMPRAPHKRGNDSKSQPCAMACVLCAVERGGQSYGEMLGIGTAGPAKLEYAFKNRLSSDVVAVSDRAHGMKAYFSNTSIELIQVAAHVGKKASPPEIKGSFHIQNVNNMHYRIRTFMRKYNGVATKYLNHYVNLFVWLENHKKIQNIDLDNEIYNYIKEQHTYIRGRDLAMLPSLPCAA